MCTLEQSSLPVEIISRYSAWQEVYSIDESFVGLRGAPEELERVGTEIRQAVRQLTGVPVRIAMGATKSLAKVAAIGIKKTAAMNGVLHVGRYCEEQTSRILESIPVTDLWGVAGRSGRKLAAMPVLAAPRVLDEGVDVPEAERGIVLAANRSKRQLVQRLGRVIRRKKDGRAGKLAYFYAKETIEDPEVSGDEHLNQVLPYARDLGWFVTCQVTLPRCLLFWITLPLMHFRQNQRLVDIRSGNQVCAFAHSLICRQVSCQTWEPRGR